MEILRQISRATMADDIYYFVIIEMQKWRVLYYNTFAGVRLYQNAASGLELAFRRKWWMAIVTILFGNLSLKNNVKLKEKTFRLKK